MNMPENGGSAEDYYMKIDVRLTKEQQELQLERIDPAEYEAKLILQQRGEPMTFEDRFWKLIEKI